MALAGDVVLGPAQLAARGDGQLLLDDIDAGHHLGHGMFDLQPGVHLQEVEVARAIEQELDGAGVAVAHRLCGAHRHLRPSRSRSSGVTATEGASSISF